MTPPDEPTPETLRKWANAGDMPIDGLEIASAWAADRKRLEALEKERDADWRKFVHLRDDNERIRVLGEELAQKEAHIEELVREKRRLQGRLDAASLWAVKAAVVLANEFQSLLRGEEER